MTKYHIFLDRFDWDPIVCARNFLSQREQTLRPVQDRAFLAIVGSLVNQEASSSFTPLSKALYSDLQLVSVGQVYLSQTTSISAGLSAHTPQRAWEGQEAPHLSK